MKIDATSAMSMRKAVAVSLGLLGTVISQQALALTSVTDTGCSAELQVTVATNGPDYERTSVQVLNSDCQERDLTASGGFALTGTAPTDTDTADSSVMTSAGGELYEAFVGGGRGDAVLLTPNRALMMSRTISGNARSVDWDMGLAVQPVTSGTNAWLAGTYTLLRANKEVRIAGDGQVDAALSEVFDPVTMSVAFDGNGGCTVSGHSSWFAYGLTTDPAGTYSQPDGSDYGLHQAVYAGEGYSGTNGTIHPDADLTYSNCGYTLGSDGKLLVTYDYTDGDANPFSVENAYYVSADLRYIVSTVNAGSDLYRGFELGVRVPSLTGTQQENNDSVAGTFLYNVATIDLQGSTGDSVDNVNQVSEKSSQCMNRGSIELTTTPDIADWNTCNMDMTSTCSVSGAQDEVPSLSLNHTTSEGAVTINSCRFQVGTDGAVDFVVNMTTAEGDQDVSFNGAVADNNEALVIRTKYEGSNMTDPSNTFPPERDILNDVVVGAGVALKYEGTLAADADSDGLDNLGEFLYSSYITKTYNDFTGDGIAGWIWKGEFNGLEGVTRTWAPDWDASPPVGWIVPARTYPPDFDAALTWDIMTTGDFNGDGDADWLWRARSVSDARWKVWQMQDGNRAAQNNPPQFDADHDWTVIGAGDTDNDGDDDVILNNASTGEILVWEMQDHAVANTHSIGTKAGYDLARVGDFDGDNDVDFLLHLQGGNTLRFWEIEDNAFVQEIATNQTGAGFSTQCAGDFDGDGDDDVYLLATDGTSKYFEYENFVRQQQVFGANQALYDLYGCADFDGDGIMDLQWTSADGEGYNRITLQAVFGVRNTKFTNRYGGTSGNANGYGFEYRNNRN